MLKEKEAVIRRAMIVCDVLVISLAFVLAYLIRKYFHTFYTLDLVPSANVVAGAPAPISNYLVVVFLIVPIWCITLYWYGMYRSMRTKTFLEIAWIIIKAAFLTTITFGTLAFLFKLKFVSRVFFIFFMAISAFFILFEKITIFSIMRYVRRQGYNYRRLVIVGTGERAVNFINRINKHQEWGFKIEAVLDYDSNLAGRRIGEIEVTGTLEKLPDILHEKPVDEVIFIVPRAKLNEIENSLYVCETEGVKATIAVDLFELKIARARQTELDGVPFITFETTFAHEWQLFVKRALDIVVSALGIVLLSPVFLIVAVLIKLTSPGGALFRQERAGLNGRTFVLYKFRTMHEGSHEKLSDVEALNEMGGPVFKIKNDPRVTPVGRFLRKFSIDEFPQLFNVFLGHMSLVGPRPPIPKEVERYKPWQRRRLSMRPGLTCLWQISGRNKINFDEWMKLDLEYLDNWSLWLDFKILVKTVPVILLGTGAY